MEKIDFKNCDLDDVIFEHRNKAYGAYFLRKKYSQHVKKAALWGTAVFLILISSPLIADKMAANRHGIDEGKVALIELPPPPTPPVKPPTPPPPPITEPKKQVATITFTPPKVQDNPIEEPPIPKMDDITVAVSTKTQEGVKENLPPIVEPTAPPVEVPTKEKPVEVEDNSTFIIVEQNPEFENGNKAMYAFLSKNIIYPVIAKENGIQGTVFVGFVVSKDGTIRNVEIKRGIGGGCNEEAIRVIKLMPKWKPGKQNGKAVNVAFTLPVKFRLD